MNKGFTLLEVVIAVVMLAVSLSIIIKIYTNYIRDFAYYSGQVENIQKVKRFVFNIQEENKEIPFVKIQYKETPYSLKKKLYIYNDEVVLFSYEQK